MTKRLSSARLPPADHRRVISLIARIQHRYPWIGYAGVIIVFYVACRMIFHGGMPLLQAS